MGSSGQGTSTVEDQVHPASALRAFAQEVFEQSDMPADAAAALADHLIWAETRGLTWLGLRKITQCVDRLRAGGTRPAAEPTVVSELGALVVLDGGDTWGQVVGVEAMRRAIEKASANGIGAAAVRNTTSGGALGYYAMMAANARMIGVAINNSPALQAPSGSAEKAIGTQAFAVSSPAGRHPPLLLDMATSAMSLARMHELEQRGERLPAGVALTADGQPTTDPAAALEGILLPMGGHRGYALAVLWEVLTGVLAGGPRFAGDLAMPTELDRPQGTSLFFLAIDPTVAMPYDEFVDRVDVLIDRLHACSPLPGADPVTVPGERTDAIAAERGTHGIPVAADVAMMLTDLGATLGVPFP